MYCIQPERSSRDLWRSKPAGSLEGCVRGCVIRTSRAGRIYHVVNGVRKLCIQTDPSPSYMPKFFLVLDHASFPKLPIGNPNLKALEEMANKHVDEEGELFENAVIHRCRATRSGL